MRPGGPELGTRNAQSGQDPAARAIHGGTCREHPASGPVDNAGALRPDGAKGLLVSSLASFSEYQRERAWTWEHQALVRARGIAGDDALLQAFEVLRDEVLARKRDADALREDVVAMRRRMRAELDRNALQRVEGMRQQQPLALRAQRAALCQPCNARPRAGAGARRPRVSWPSPSAAPTPGAATPDLNKIKVHLNKIKVSLQKMHRRFAPISLRFPVTNWKKQAQKVA